MGKNGNGEGSIYEHKRNGKKIGYRGAYTVYTAEGPKRRYVSGKTREEVRQKLTKDMADRDGGLVCDAGSLTVGEYLERWLKDSTRGVVRPSTYQRYEGLIRLHVAPVLGRAKLKNLLPTKAGAYIERNWTVGYLLARCRRYTLYSARRSPRLYRMALSLAMLHKA